MQRISDVRWAFLPVGIGCLTTSTTLADLQSGLVIGFPVCRNPTLLAASEPLTASFVICLLSAPHRLRLKTAARSGHTRNP